MGTLSIRLPDELDQKLEFEKALAEDRLSAELEQWPEY
jgi:predicted transcriptional regulator